MDTSIVAEPIVESKTLTLTTYEDAFAQFLLESDKSRKTIRIYAIGFRVFQEWFERTNGQLFDPARITRVDVRLYKEYLIQERRSPARTVNTYLSALRSFCQFAVETGLIFNDPSRGFKGIKIHESELTPRWLTKSEMENLLREAENQVNAAIGKTKGKTEHPGYVRAMRDLTIVSVLLATGIRLSELANLHLEDFVINPRSGKMTVHYGKGGKTRSFDLNYSARKALAAWLEVRPNSEGVNNLLTSQKEGALTARAIARRVEFIAKRVGIHVTPHMLRHTYAKRTIDAGARLNEVGRAMGHENIDTTKRYVTPSDEDMRRAVEGASWEEDPETERDEGRRGQRQSRGGRR